MISHDLAAARYLSTRLAVMYAGKLVEMGSATQSAPHHGILIRKRCCPQPCPCTPLYGGSIILQGDSQSHASTLWLPLSPTLPTGHAPVPDA
jgi:hypothetical protein